MATSELNPRSPVPLYRQVADIIIAAIESAELPELEPIPSQTVLTERFHVARGTVAKALKHLQQDGYVFLVVGRGLWVTPKDKRRKRPS